ncbi:MAG: acetyl-CoA carboxylase carboxyltransferase subunit alpha [Phycisphaerae bacterium]|nr:acetyl-CoA carboxylase carboxyltransferase subunit alpha [Phycisphaerae bacterium]
MSSEPQARTGGSPRARGVGSSVAVGMLEFEKPLARIEREIAELEALQAETQRDLSAEIKELRTTLETMMRRTYANLTPWETVLVARHPRRPVLPDYLDACVKDFCELHGDRCFGDDKAIMTGFGRIGGHKVLIVGHDKGRDTKEKIERHFGCAHPEGYRKALLKMKMAEKFKVPILCIIDTQGAYPGDKAEERGIAQAIAVNLMEMSRLRVPILCVVIGEGGSGGALGIGVGDRLAMFEHAYYSVITPEGCAAILWKTASQAPHAAKALGLNAKTLKKLNLIDDILPEPMGGGHRNPAAMFATFEKYVGEMFRELKRVRIDTLLKRRYERLRSLGNFFESLSEKKTARRPRARKAKAAVPATPSVGGNGDGAAKAASGNGEAAHRGNNGSSSSNGDRHLERMVAPVKP